MNVHNILMKKKTKKGFIRVRNDHLIPTNIILDLFRSLLIPYS